MFNALSSSADAQALDEKFVFPHQPGRASSWQIDLIVISILALIELSIIIWTVYDHSIPCWDTAAHKLNSFRVYELLRHPHFSHLYWYRNIFAVSPLYPPFYYFVSAFLKLIVGAVVNTELISNLIFMTVLFFSLNYAGQAVNNNKLAGYVSACLVFLYPAVYWSAHIASLDFAANAMIALGLACFLWWTDSPCLRRSIVLGLVLGLATLTKNNTPLFLIGPILADLIFAISRKRDYARIKQLAVVALAGFIVVLPWLVLAGPTVLKFVAAIQRQNFYLNSYSASTQLTDSIPSGPNWLIEFLTHCRCFIWQDLSVILSPLFCGCFVIALIVLRPFNRNVIYLLASIVGGIVIASAFRWPHQFRYIVPAVAPIAALTAPMFAQMWQSRRAVLRIAFITIVSIGLLQLMYEAWCPYPLHLPSWAKIVMQMVNEDFKTRVPTPEVDGISVNPLPNCDWGTMWALSAIEAYSGGRTTGLMIVPGCNEINCSSYYYLTKINKDGIEVASPRQHTELGDQVRFDPKLAAWYEWYILKTGNQGRQLCDAESKTDYSRWIEFARNAKLYQLVKKKPLPDGSTMQLYRRLFKMGSQR